MKMVLIVVAMVVVFNGILLYSGALDRLRESSDAAVPVKDINPNVLDVFRFTLEDEVQKKQGKPKEGYEPAMFLALYPGLVPTDFNGVESSIGGYTISEGKLQHDIGNAALIHSAAGAITRDGYETLLKNIADRNGIDLTTDGTITDIMETLVSE